MISQVSCQLSHTLLIALAVAAMAATVTSLATSLFVARRVTVPLRQMTQASQRISAGRYAERIEVMPVHATDELGQLAASINALAVALEQTERRRLEVIGNVAHELRTPIATLEGYLEGLLDGVIEPSPGTWAILHTQAGRLRRLVDDLQELSRAEARQIPLSPQPVSPQRLIQSALEPLEGQFAEKGLQLQVHLPEDLPPVMADPARAVQILTNLLVNALRYTPTPGKVELAVSREEDMVAFRVTDTGVGLAMVLFWVAIILLLIWVVRSLFPRQMRSGHDQALETLRQRYAAGEINAAEYEQARARLEQTPVV